MSVKKWIPWNWFKKEEEDAGQTVPVQRHSDGKRENANYNPIAQFHHEVDRLFDQAFRGFGLSPFNFNQPRIPHITDGMIMPTLDLAATDSAYTATLEVPGVAEGDVKVEIANDIMTIRGEKKQENEERGKDYYRMERSYGSFQRTLSLPEDADQEKIKANFERGILTVTMQRKARPKTDVRQIEVKVG